MSLCTPDDVRNRLGYTDPTLSNAVLQDYIDDSEAYIFTKTLTEWIPADGYKYRVASSACKDLAAVHAIIRPAGGVIEGLDYKIDELTVNKSKQLESRLKTANQFRQNVREALDVLETIDTSVPMSNTGAYG